MHLQASEIKRMLKKWHFYKACILPLESGNELERKLNAVEKAVAALDDVDKTIIQLKFMQGADIDLIASKVFLAHSSVYKRIDKAIQELAYLIANTG